MVHQVQGTFLHFSLMCMSLGRPRGVQREFKRFLQHCWRWRKGTMYPERRNFTVQSSALQKLQECLPPAAERKTRHLQNFFPFLNLLEEEAEVVLQLAKEEPLPEEDLYDWASERLADYHPWGWLGKLQLIHRFLLFLSIKTAFHTASSQMTCLHFPVAPQRHHMGTAQSNRKGEEHCEITWSIQS